MNKERNRIKNVGGLIIISFFAFMISLTGATAAIQAAGPIDPVNGFPVWYQDNNNLALEACLAGPDGLADPLCVLPTIPPLEPNFTPALPISFPNNFPTEFFYWIVDSDVAPAGLTGAGRVRFRYALEGAFVSPDPQPNQQIAFLRVNLQPISDLVPGATYTVTHPFGQFALVAAQPIQPAITGVTPRHRDEDGAFGPPLTDITAASFLTATTTNIGPFLRQVNPVPPAGYIGDAITLSTIESGPNGNFIQITGPSIDINNYDGDGNPNSLTISLWTVSGKIFNGVVPTALSIQHSVYTRTAGGQGYADIFATSDPTAAVKVNAIGVIPETPMIGDGTGKFFAHIPLAGASTLPPTITVTANNSLPNTAFKETTLTSNLVDLITISMVNYNPTIPGTLTIKASSSDQLVPQNLTATGLGTLTSGSLIVSTPVPPATVTVTSSAGGNDNEIVRVQENTPPVALDDSARTTKNTPTVISLLANDTDSDGTLNPASVTVISGPLNGAVSVNPATGSATYTPNLNFAGGDSFTYTVKDNLGAVSNIATVNIEILALNLAPVALGDSARTTKNTPVVISLLANDTDSDGTLNPASVTVIIKPTNGALSVNPATGSATYTPNVNFLGSDSFTYTVKDNLGAVSNVGRVSINVGGVGELITVRNAAFTSLTKNWFVSGTTTVRLPNSITIRSGPNFTGPIIGVANVNKSGLWSLNLSDSTVLPDATKKISVQSTQGTLVLNVGIQSK